MRWFRKRSNVLLKASTNVGTSGQVTLSAPNFAVDRSGNMTVGEIDSPTINGVKQQLLDLITDLREKGLIA